MTLAATLLLSLPAANAAPSALAAAAPTGSADDLAQHIELEFLVERAREPGCKTPLVEALRLHWDHLPDDLKSRATEQLAPFKSDLFSASGESHAEGAAPPARGGCWDQELDNSIIGDHFIVEYEDGVNEDDARLFLNDLEFSWEVEVDDREWRQPDRTDNYLFTTYIQNQNTGGAYTTVRNCQGAYMPYIVSGKDSWRDEDWGATMAAHEFNHASQFGYSYAPEFWYWESTATWMENIVYPDIKEWGWYVTGYTDNPWIALNAESQRDYDVFYHMYGMAIWNFFMEDNLGGHDTIRATWENAQDERGQYGYGAKDMVEELGQDWDSVYIDFISRNGNMDYAEHNSMPRIDLADSVSSLPAEGGSGRDEPQGYGQNYIKFADDMGKGHLVIEFEGDDSVDWAVVLVEGDNKTVMRTVVETVKNGSATLTLEDYGTETVWLVVSPLTSKDDGYSYSWKASLQKPAPEPEDTGSTDDTGETGGPRDGNGGGNGDGNADGSGVDASPIGGCGCTSANPAAALSGLVAAGGLLALRRRG